MFKITRIVLIFILISSCSTFKLAEIISNDILDNIDNGGARYDNSNNFVVSDMEESEELDLTISDIYFNKEEVKNMEQPEIITMITSIIAGLYAVVKTIINLIKRVKK